MYETLATGQVHRTMTVADLNLLEPPQGPDPERAAPPSWAGVNFLDVDNVAPHSNADGSTTSQDWNPDPQAGNVAAAFSRTRDDARILANAATTTDFAGQTAQLLEKGPSEDLLSHFRLTNAQDLDDFWSSLAVTRLFANTL